MAAAATSWRVDGRADPSIPPDDRGLLYGDGVFRTVRVVGGVPWLWDAHLDRLIADAHRIGLAVDTALRTRLDADARALSDDASGILRVTLTRGSGPRGYVPPIEATPRSVLQFTEQSMCLPEPVPIVLQIARTRLACSPALAGIKHLGRLEQVLAAGEPAAPGVFDRLMCDPDGAIVCATRANLFVRQGRRLLTPRLDRCGVAGVMRAEVLAWARRHAEMLDEVVETTIDRSCLVSADELCVSNAVMGVRSVHRVLDEAGRVIVRRDGPFELFAGMEAALAPPCDTAVEGRRSRPEAAV